MVRNWIMALAALALSVPARALDPQAQRLAARYEKILEGNPVQSTALNRFWQIYDSAGETEALLKIWSERAGHDAASGVIYAQLLEKAGQNAQAAEAFAQAVRLDPKTPRWRELQANSLAAQSRGAEAAAILKTAAADFPDDASLLIHLGEVQLALGDRKSALAAWEKAVERAPNDLELRRKTARILAEAGEFPGAIAHERIIAEHSGTSERLQSLQNICDFAGRAGDLTEAIRAQEQILALLGPGHWQREAATNKLLTLCERQGSLEAREKLWRDEAAAKPRDPVLAVRLAMFYAFTGREEKRRDWLQKALDLLPGDSALLRELSDVELGLGGAAAAVKLRERILEARPDDVDNIFLLAEAEALSGKAGPAGERIEKLLAAQPGDAELNARALEFFRRLHLDEPLRKQLSQKAGANPKDVAAALALAASLVQQGRTGEAEAAFRRLDTANLAPGEHAQALHRFGDVLANARLERQAFHWFESAFTKDPANPDHAVAFAEALLARGEKAKAVEVIETCAAKQEGRLPREDLDRLLFTTLQFLESEKPVTLLPPGTGNPEIGKRIQVLRDAAEQTSSEAAWLRLARWQRWVNAGRDAMTSLQSALFFHPESLSVRENLVNVAMEIGQIPAALQQLREIAVLQPDQSRESRRRIANLELDRGNPEEALRIFNQLAVEQPSNWRTIADLALAEQRAENWFHAFESWQRAARLAPPDSRRGVRQSLLTAAARLAYHDKALEFLSEAVRTEPDASARREILDDALAYARDHHVLDLWRAKLEAERARSPQDAWWQFGLAGLLRESGKAGEADTLLATLEPTGSESPDQLDLLLRAARESRDWDKAAALARRIARAENGYAFASWAAYAEILEKAGRTGEAAEVWDGLAARFARSPEALLSAADFFERAGDPAKVQKCLRQAALLSNPEPDLLLRLGGLSQASGDRVQALRDFEAVLQIAQPEEKGWQTSLPAVERLAQIRTAEKKAVLRAWAEKPAPSMPVPTNETPEGCRLLAIKAMGKLLAHSPEKGNWLENPAWKTRPAIEKVWALYYSGEFQAAIASAGEILSREKAFPEAIGALAAMALESGSAKFLAQWANEADSLERWRSVLSAFEQMLGAGWRPSPDFLRALFSDAPATVSWHAAQLLAGNRQVQAAIAAAQPAMAKLPAGQLCAAWLTVGDWQLSLRNIGEAEKAFDEAIASALPSMDFSQPVFSAIRQRWLLADGGDRARVAERALDAATRTEHPGFQAATRAFLQGLENAPAPDLQEVVSRIGSNEEENWAAVVQQGGWQLESWGMDRMARELYREFLRTDPGYLATRGELPLQRTTEMLLITSQLASARGPRTPFLLHEWVARRPRDEDILLAASRLAPRSKISLEFYKEALRRNPGNETAFLGMINTALATQRFEEVWPFLKDRLQSAAPQSPRAIQGNAWLPISEWLEKNGRFDEALFLLDAMRAQDRKNIAVLRQQAGLLARLGRFPEALRLLEPEAAGSSDSQLRIQYAGLLAGLGNEKQAMAFLENRTAPNRVSALMEACTLLDLERQTGDVSGARHTERKLMGLAENETPEKTPGIRPKPSSPEEDFSRMQYVLLTWLEMPEKIRLAELARIERLARKNPGLLAGYFTLRKELARRLKALDPFKAELLAEWAGGQGDYYAGEILLQLALEEGRAKDLDALLDGFLTERNFNEAAWSNLAAQLLQKNEPQRALRIYEALSKMNAGGPEQALLHAEALWKCGNPDAAEAIIAPITRIARVEERLHLPLASLALNIGKTDLAESHLRSFPAGGRAPQQAALWARLAREMIRAGNREKAREALQYASESGVPPVAEFAAYDTGNGASDPAGHPPNFSPAALREYRAEITGILLEKKDVEGAWKEMETDPAILLSPAARNSLAELAAKDPERAIRLWKLAGAQGASWEIRSAAAEFLFEQAKKADQKRQFALLEEAHKLAPSSLPVARMLAQACLQAGKPEAARAALQDVVASFTTPANRREARRLLDSLALSGALPQES